MKKIFSIFMTFTLLVSLFSVFAVNTSAESIEYVKDFQFGVADTEEEAIELATQNGYVLVDGVQLNLFTPGSVTYLGYKTTIDELDTVRDVILFVGEEYATMTSWLNPSNNCTYYPVGGCVGDEKIDAVNVDYGCEGTGAYLFYTKDPHAGNPISYPTANCYTYTLFEDRNNFVHDNNGNAADFDPSYPGTINIVYNQCIYYSALQVGVSTSYSTARKYATTNNFIPYYENSILSYTCTYFAYSTTGSKADAIKDIICLTGEEYATCTEYVNPNNGCTYYPVGGYNDASSTTYVETLNINSNMSGLYTYLFVTTDEKAGDPITDIAILNKTDRKWKSVLGSDNKAANISPFRNLCDDSWYILFKRGSYSNYYGSIFTTTNSGVYIAIGGAILVIAATASIIISKKSKKTVIV